MPSCCKLLELLNVIIARRIFSSFENKNVLYITTVFILANKTTLISIIILRCIWFWSLKLWNSYRYQQVCLSFLLYDSLRISECQLVTLVSHNRILISMNDRTSFSLMTTSKLSCWFVLAAFFYCINIQAFVLFRRRFNIQYSIL